MNGLPRAPRNPQALRFRSARLGVSPTPYTVNQPAAPAPDRHGRDRCASACICASNVFRLAPRTTRVGGTGRGLGGVRKPASRNHG